MAVYNMPRPNTRPYAGGSPHLSAFSGRDEARKGNNYGTRPSQPVLEPGSGYGSKTKPGFSGATRPPQSVQPIGSGFSGNMKPMRPPQQAIQPIGAGFSGQMKPFGGDQQITPIGSGFSGDANFGADLASAFLRPQQVQPTGGGIGGQITPMPPAQTNSLPWWYRNNRQQPPNQQMGSLGAALNQFYGGGSNSVMNPTFHML